MIQRSEPNEQWDREFAWQRVIRYRGVTLWQVIDPRGVEMWLPSDLLLTVCSLCDRYCTTDVPILYRELVSYYQRGRNLPERAARKHNGRPQCRECLEYQSQQSRYGNGWQDRRAIIDGRLKGTGE